MKKSYVYKGKEYVLTGRTAKPKISLRRTKDSNRSNDDNLYEIRPSDVTDVNDRKYNEWVKMRDLYEVEDNV